MMRIRLAARSARLSPALSSAIVGTFALAMCAAGLGWGAFDTLVLRSVPGDQPARVVRIGLVRAGAEGPVGLALADVAALQRGSRSLAAIGSYQPVSAPTVIGSLTNAHVIHTTSGFFESFAIQPQAGRWFGSHEQAACSVVISDAVLAAVFGREAAAVGRTLPLPDEQCVVVGVAPEGFGVPDYPAQVWRHRALAAGAMSNARDQVVVALPRDGLFRDDVAAELGALAVESAGGTTDGTTFTVTSLRDVVVGPVRRSLGLMIVAVFALLLAASANVTALLLARAWGRRKELAVRRSLGARRRDLMLDALTGTGLLACVGGVIGLGLTYGAMELVRAIGMATVPQLRQMQVDPRVVAAVFVPGLLIAGVVAVASTYREHLVARRFEAHRWAGVLVAAQVALSVVLAISTGLLAHSLSAVLRIDVGFQPHGLDYYHFTRDRRESLDVEGRALRGLLDDVRRVPGVEAVALTAWPPFLGVTERTRFEVETEDGWKVLSAALQNVTWDYFDVMQIPVVRGRVGRGDDLVGAPCEVVVNESFAREMWPSEPPLGRRLDMYMQQGRPLARTGLVPRFCAVVGIVGDVRERVLTEPAVPRVYFSAYQRASGAGTLVVRQPGEPLLAAPRVLPLIAEWVPQASRASVRIGSVPEQMRSSVKVSAFHVWLFGSFAAGAVALLAVGVFGVNWYAVSRRTHEIGIRLSLGATPMAVVRLLAWQGARPVLVGGVLGLILASQLTHYLASTISEISVLDPFAFSVMPMLVVGVAVLAVVVPVMRGAHVDPRQVLDSSGQ